jgi:hypothetical protein
MRQFTWQFTSTNPWDCATASGLTFADESWAALRFSPLRPHWGTSYPFGILAISATF